MKIIGLMSGTSVDGIDAALTEVSGEGYQVSAQLIKGITHAYPEALRSQILSVCAHEPITLTALAELDDAIAYQFIKAIEALDVDLSTIDLIGSHGQTLYHRPPEQVTKNQNPPDQNTRDQSNQLGYTLQLGRGELIAQATGRPTISNFRGADIALGGQGAPLVPIIDACLLSNTTQHIAVQNIGGIGNVTYLPPWDRASNSTVPLTVKGWDTGPGNALIDWAVTNLSDGQKTYDKDGQWAAQGTPCQPLIDQWLQHPFFKASPPKSTGRELFGADYAKERSQEAASHQLGEADLLATLTDFTAATIELSYRQFLPTMPAEVLIGGGGSRNQYLMNRLQHRLPTSRVVSTSTRQLDADYKEAIAFAILAYWRWHNIPGNLPSVTGALRPCLLGNIWQP